MSKKYDEYIINHRRNVERGYNWLKKFASELFDNLNEIELNKIEKLCNFTHDLSKIDKEEYNAYDEYFYGKNKEDPSVISNFNKAWLYHIHHNPHHWQHWVLNCDEPNEGEILIEMPFEYVIEMICDWWSFSWKVDNLYEIFNWYNGHKDYIKLNSNTKILVEEILLKIKNGLDKGTD